MGLGRRQQPPLTIFSQNCRGLKTNGRIDELVHVLQERRAFLACVQETWRCGSDDVVCGDWTFLGVGPEQQRGRGSQGVGIFLSPRATTALRLGGTEVHRESPRVMAVRLQVHDGRSKRQLGAFVLNSYAPVSTSPEEEWVDYYASVDRALSYKRPDDVLVWCCDANASMGTDQRTHPEHTLARWAASAWRILMRLDGASAPTWSCSSSHRLALTSVSASTAPGRTLARGYRIRSTTSSQRVETGSGSSMRARVQASCLTATTVD